MGRDLESKSTSQPPDARVGTLESQLALPDGRFDVGPPEADVQKGRRVSVERCGRAVGLARTQIQETSPHTRRERLSADPEFVPLLGPNRRGPEERPDPKED